MATSREFEVVLVPEEDGGYSVTVPALPGCTSQGDTRQFVYNGRSIVVDPHGEIVADAAAVEASISARLDLAALLEYRRGLPFLADMRGRLNSKG